MDITSMADQYKKNASKETKSKINCKLIEIIFLNIFIYS